ncbi:MAG: hypothetical protein P8Y97_12040, partial [Candidatus Lokiarchaeota archaeon]
MITSIPENFITQIKELMKSVRKIENPKRHQFFQANLIRSFEKNGFRAEKEYEIKYIYVYKTDKYGKKGSIKLRSGFLDLFVQKNELKIALEFDRIGVLRLRNLEKLMQCYPLLWNNSRAKNQNFSGNSEEKHHRLKK